jgi:cytochrome c oxidase assembly protein subunit 15
MVWFQRINLLTLLLCFCVIVFGAYVRLSDAGLGCPDWPGCYGHLAVPSATHDVAAAEQAFPQRPVEAPKAWKEMIHRYLASTLGLLIVALALMSLRIRDARVPRLLPWVLVALVIFQGVLGMWTVTWQLKPLAVTGHLLGGMTTMSLLLWMWLGARRRLPAVKVHVVEREMRNERQAAWAMRREVVAEAAYAAEPAPRGLRLFAGVALTVVAVQIFLGGWTSTNYAALACPDFPTCHGSYWPQTDVPTAYTLWHGLGINYEYGILDARARVTIHFFHRVGALVVTVVLVLLGLFLLRATAPRWRVLGLAVLAALTLQVGIGISVVVLQLPLWLADAHNAGAALLLAVMVTLNRLAWWAPHD